MEHALGDRVQANWPCVLYPSAMMAAAAAQPRRLPGARAAAGLGLALTLIVYLQAALRPLPLGRGLDVTTRLAGWRGLAGAVGAADAPLGLPIVADEYGLASELAWWNASEIGAVGPRWSLFRLAPMLAGGERVLLITRADRRGPDPALWSDLQPVGSVTRFDGRLPVEQDALFVAVARTPPPVSARLPGHPPR